MRLKIKKTIILEGLNNVSKALSNRNIIPVLNGILLQLNEEGLYLTATDNDLTIKSFICRENITEINAVGECIIIGRYLLDIIRKLPSEEIIIEEVDGGKAIISTETSKYNLNCYNLGDYPNIKIDESEHVISLNVKSFKDAINQTVFSCSTQESRPLLTGINLKVLGNIMECVATDSYRLGKKIIELEEICDSKINLVVPAKNINEFVKIIEEDEENILMYAFSNKVLFKYKNILFQSSLLNGTYPNTDTLIPETFEYVIEANLNELFDVIDRASLLTQVKDKNIIQMETKGDNLIITCSSLEIGKVEEVMKVKVISGDDIKISFSAKYMIECLKSFNSDNIRLLLNGEIKPIIIKEPEEDKLIHLILPIKTY